MLRLAASALVALCLAVGCSDGASTSSGELGSAQGDVTPEPTASIREISEAPTVVEIVEPTPEPEGPEPFVVASVMGENGVLSPIDGPAVAGVVAEIDRINEAGGILGRPIELQRFDTDSRAGLTERVAERLVEAPPHLIIASCDTAFSGPLLELADEHGVLTISPCADDVRYLTGGLGSRSFTLGAPAEQQGEIAAAAALERYGSTALVLRDVTSPEAMDFCDGFERRFRELGGSVVYRDEFSYDTLEPVQDRLDERAPPASFITLCSHVPGGLDAAPSIILMLRSIGFDAPIVGGSTLDEPGWFSDVATLGELMFVSWASNFGNDPDDRIDEVVRRAQQNPETPGAGVTTILGAESIEAWARAVEAADSDAPERIATALASFNDEPFSTGPLSFVAGARMDLGRTYRVLLVVEGQLTVLDTVTTDD